MNIYSTITNFYVTPEWLPVYRQNEIIEMRCFNILVLSVAKGYFILKIKKTKE